MEFNVDAVNHFRTLSGNEKMEIFHKLKKGIITPEEAEGLLLAQG